MIVVSDASPLIALARIDRLELLREMFGTLLLPDSVWNEITNAGMERAGGGFHREGGLDRAKIGF